MRDTPPLRQLPNPPSGKTGWPWTADNSRQPPRQNSDALEPRLSIVTPSLNQAEFLEATLRSVLLQGYANLEYIVVDGGSTDGSLDIIRRYEPWLTWWISEPDSGQSDAINKGFGHATGEVLGWLNSDDVLLPGALAHVADGFRQHPSAVLVYGAVDQILRDGSRLGPAPQVRACDRHVLLFENNVIAQPGAFFKRESFQAVGGLTGELYYSMDYDLWLRLSAIGILAYLPQPLASMRLYPEAKTGRANCDMFAEIRRVVERHGGRGLPTQMTQWLVAMALPRALAAFRQGDAAAGQADLACILEHAPAWRSADRLAETIASEAWRLMNRGASDTPSGLAWAVQVCRGLPSAWVNPHTVECRTLGLLYEALAIQSYRHGDYVSARRYAWQAVNMDKSRLANRGLWSAAVRSIFKWPAASHR